LEHSKSVARLLYAIAGDIGLDTSRAVAAGLLHDSCKSLKDDAMLDLARRFGVVIGDIQLAKPNLLHGHVAAEVCKSELGIDEPEVYEAVYWHVTGRPGLGRLGQALFFADFSEPSRRHPLSSQARTIYDECGFDTALRFAAQGKLAYLVEKGVAVDPQTQAFHDWLVTEQLS
jgi:predicted HD superfamily hydrolase involved in NAD metabolism